MNKVKLICVSIAIMMLTTVVCAEKSIIIGYESRDPDQDKNYQEHRVRSQLRRHTPKLLRPEIVRPVVILQTVPDQGIRDNDDCNENGEDPECLSAEE